MNMSWYVRRLSRMSAPEIAMRGRDSMVRLLWRRHWVRDMGADQSPLPIAAAVFTTPLPPNVADAVAPAAREHVIACADELMAGRWRVFAVERADLGSDPDWFMDPRTGRRGPATPYCFEIDHRAEDAVGNIKYVWELSRHHHLTLLAAAYHLTGSERYATRVAEQLSSWWQQNPFLSGVHWTSGIEVGVRLISWVWVRRLLGGWSGSEDLFERNATCLRQLHHHHRYLATLGSHHSSANNHVIAEAAGAFVAACAFPWFRESDAWRARAATALRRELARQTFPCGLNRELATDYHALVLELGLAAALEGEATGASLGTEVWSVLCRMMDAAAAIVDERLRPPRQGDSDDGTALLVDDPRYDRWSALLSTGAALFGALPWWPRITTPDARTTLWTSVARNVTRPPAAAAAERPAKRPSEFAEAGMIILRDPPTPAGSTPRGAQAAPEIWCRCDHGPLGFLSVAAHGHADALAIELRHGGVDVLADPGTYCYHGEPAWRSYFRSTRAHNTIELADVSQSVEGGPFLWQRPVPTRLVRVFGLHSGDIAAWQAEHRGYERLTPHATHRRQVTLDRQRRTVSLVDQVDCDGEHACRLAFHLGRTVTATLRGSIATLSWPLPDGAHGTAEFRLPPDLSWQTVRGQVDPPMGWYSPAFDQREPATTLLGTGRTGYGHALRSILRFG